MPDPYWTDPKYPTTETGQPGDEDEAPGDVESAGPVFRDGPAPTATDITSTVMAMHLGDTAATDIWQVIWQTNVDESAVASGIQGDNSTRGTETYALVCGEGQVWEGIGGRPPQPNIGN